MTYSTCSLNPIENEAVVAAALKEFKGIIRLLPAELPGFKHQKGLTTWRLLNSESKEKEGESWFKEYHSWKEVPDKYSTQIKETMFVNHYESDILQELPKCVRVMPHHQNTSGFFITVIEKIAECKDDQPIIAEEDSPADAKTSLVI